MDCERAIQELSQGYELATRLQPFIEGGDDGRTEMAKALFDQVLLTLSMSISILTSTKTPVVAVEAKSPSSSTIDDQASSDIVSAVRKVAGDPNFKKDHNNKRRRNHKNSWGKTTSAPHDDGYQWRKYGQKTIREAQHPRCYYRCTYSDEGCLATKLVQQKDCYDQDNNSPVFFVTYFEQHTCKSKAAVSTPQIIKDDCPQRGADLLLISFESTGNLIKMAENSIQLPSVDTTKQQQDYRNLQTDARFSSDHRPVKPELTTVASSPVNRPTSAAAGTEVMYILEESGVEDLLNSLLLASEHVDMHGDLSNFY